MKRKVLFLCTGNSCRSQMAEAIVNARLGDTWEAYSAGTRPAGYVHPLRCVHWPRSVSRTKAAPSTQDEYRDVSFDLVVTVCDDAAENCPVWLGRGKRVHLGFPDPAKATGGDAEVMTVFRRGARRHRAHDAGVVAGIDQGSVNCGCSTPPTSPRYSGRPRTRRAYAWPITTSASRRSASRT